MISKISVYIHWPFCLKKCPYCDFNSYVAKEISYKDWLTGYFNAIEAQKEFFKNKFIGSIFFGGGTPSLMEPEMVSQIINFFKNHNKVLSENLNIPHEEIQEITLESNPSTFEIKRFQDFKQAGVGRLSTGVQSFNSNNLKFLGRNHSAKESLIALEESNKIFNRTSFDLIMGLPNQSFNDWEKELQQAIPYIKEHISIYQLTIEEGTPFYKKKVPEAKEEQAILMYEHNIDVLESIGVNQYEISNFSKQNAQSYHNKNYWVGGEYIGIGPNAHGRVFFNNTWTATKEIKNPLKWLENSLKKQNLFEEYHILSNQERREEIVLSSLRLVKEFDKTLVPFLENNKIDKLVNEGLLEYTKDSFITTRKGRSCLNYIIYELLVQ